MKKGGKYEEKQKKHTNKARERVLVFDLRNSPAQIV
jgi:hypothetical protein